jgi:hypothetical protein
LIALIIDTHPDDSRQTTDDRFFRRPSSVVRRQIGTIRKTSFLRIVPTARGQAADRRPRPRRLPR